MTDETGPVVFDAYGTLFDPFALAAPLERRFPGRGLALAQAWRATQVRHTWLRSLMERWVDFETITGDALAQTLAADGLPTDDRLLADLLAAYRSLPPYPDVVPALAALGAERRRAILTNGTRATVEATVRAAGLEAALPTVLSVEAVRVYKPAPAVYALASQHFGVEPAAVTFVSGNAWDCAGAASYGFRVVRIRRTPEAPEALGWAPMDTIEDLSDLPYPLQRMS